MLETIIQSLQGFHHFHFHLHLHSCNFARHFLVVSGASYDKSSAGWKALGRAACLCSRAEFKSGQTGVPILKVRNQKKRKEKQKKSSGFSCVFVCLFFQRKTNEKRSAKSTATPRRLRCSSASNWPPARPWPSAPATRRSARSPSTLPTSTRYTRFRRRPPCERV